MAATSVTARTTRRWSRSLLATGATVFLTQGCASIAGLEDLEVVAGEAKQNDASSDGGGGSAGQSDASQTDQDAPQDTSQETAWTDVTPDASPTLCALDSDCFLASGAGDLCKQYQCNTAKGICLEPLPYAGPVVREVDATPIAVTFGQSNIGLPTLLVDGESVYLAAWFDDGTENDILLRRYDANGTEKAASHKGLYGSVFQLVSSSPSLMIETAGTPATKRVAFLVANAQSQSMTPCVHRFWMSLDMTVGDVSQNCLGSAGYDADPTRTAPRLVKLQNGDVPMWIQEGDLVVGNQAVTTLGSVRSFSVVCGKEPLMGAILESGMMPAAEQTYLWSSSGGALSPLNSIASGPRLGTTSIKIGEGAGIVANLLAWSHPGPNGMSVIETFQDGCTSTTCTPTTFTTPQQGQSGTSLLAPVLSMRAQSTSVDIMLGSVVAALSGTDTQMTLSAQFFSMQNAVQLMNPPVAVLSSKVVTGSPAIDKLPGFMGQTASVITDGGRVFVAWVQRDADNKATLYLRRYQITEDCKPTD